MTFHWRADGGPILNADLVAFSRGSGPILLRNPIFVCVFSGEIRTSYPLPPSGSAHDNLILFSDPRVKGWPLIDDPLVSFYIIVAYVIFTLVGPIWMRKRQPFQLKPLLILYNFSMVLYSAYIVHEVGRTLNRALAAQILRIYTCAYKRLRSMSLISTFAIHIVYLIV